MPAWAKPLRSDAAMAEIIAATETSGLEAYLVGGALRSLVLGTRVGKDYDVCVMNDADKFAKTLAKRLSAAVFLMDEENRVWRVVLKSQGLTVDVSRMKGGSIEADLGARDFTVDALAFRLKDAGRPGSRVIDPFNGERDAKRKILRLVSAGALDDDPLRVIRAIRLSVECGLRMTGETSRLVKEKTSLLPSVAMERVREESLRIFSNRGSGDGVRRLFEFGAADFIFPELKGWREFPGYDMLSHSLKTLREAEKILDEAKIIEGRPELSRYFKDDMGGVKRAAAFKLAAFLHDAGKPFTATLEGEEPSFTGHDAFGEEVVKKILRRLKFGRKAVKVLSSVARNHRRVFVLSRMRRPSKRTKAHFFNAVGSDAGVMALLTALSDARARPTLRAGAPGGEDENVYECVSGMLDFYFGVYTKMKTKPLLSGEEVMRIFGVKEGPEVGRIMKEVEDIVSFNDVLTRRRAIEIVKKGRMKKG